MCGLKSSYPQFCYPYSTYYVLNQSHRAPSSVQVVSFHFLPSDEVQLDSTLLRAILLCCSLSVKKQAKGQTKLKKPFQVWDQSKTANSVAVVGFTRDSTDN
jgi:hypothetical protein